MLFGISIFQLIIAAAILCFFFGFSVQILFHILPHGTTRDNGGTHHGQALPVLPHNHFYMDGEVYDVTSEEIVSILRSKVQKSLRNVADGEISFGDLSEHRPLIDAVRSSTDSSASSSSSSSDCSDSSNQKLGLFVADKQQSLIVEDEVPEIVRAWRAAKLDWHQLLPQHNSIWERFGTPQKEGKLRLLVSKETLVTDYLTRFHESGLSAMYGKDHGPLLAYSGCNAFRSGCMIHNIKKCIEDQTCGWSNAQNLCVDATDPSADPETVPNRLGSCSNPMRITDRGVGSVHNAGSYCKVWVNQPAVLVSFDSEAQSMFYHWWAAFSGLVEKWRDKLGANRQVHFFLNSINDPMFFSFFGLLSDNCWQRTRETPNEGICFCEVQEMRLSQSRSSPVSAADQMVKFLQLQHVKPPKDRIKVGIISRRRKRFILNEYELVRRVQQLDYEVELLPLEAMTIYEQMRSLRSLDVMIGIHGSALDNSVFLHPESVLVQLLPYKVEHRCTFRSSAEKAGVHYQEWQLSKRENTVLHWDLLDQADSNKLKHMTKEQYLSKGQIQAGTRETLMFWINQDIIVPMDEWDGIVRRAVVASPAVLKRHIKP